MSATADAPREILLRGNVRPVVGLAIVAAAVVLAGAALVAVATPPAWLVGLCVVVAALVLGLCGAAWLAAGPRLVRRGPNLEVRVAPFVVERVPLDLVECVFPGSQPVGDGSAADTPRQRVTTLIVRLAERATAWSRRPGMTWVAWDDGAIVVDGRWCEPLSPAVVRGVAARLIEIKRELTGANA